LTVIKSFSGVDMWLRLVAMMVIYLLLSRKSVSLKVIREIGNEGMKYWFNKIRIDELGGLLKMKKFGWLDLGCGDGSLVHMLEEEGIKAVGVDAKQGQKIEKLKMVGKFGVVSMYHVLEHVDDPTLVLKRVKKWLRFDGFLVLEVPLVGSLSERWLGKEFLIYCDKTHVNFWIEKELLRLLAEHGWEVVERGRVWQQFPFHLATAGFKKGILWGGLSVLLWLPLKLLSVAGLNNEIVRFYCKRS